MRRTRSTTEPRAQFIGDELTFLPFCTGKGIRRKSPECEHSVSLSSLSLRQIDQQNRTQRNTPSKSRPGNLTASTQGRAPDEVTQQIRSWCLVKRRRLCEHLAFGEDYRRQFIYWASGSCNAANVEIFPLMPSIISLGSMNMSKDQLTCALSDASRVACLRFASTSPPYLYID